MTVNHACHPQFSGPVVSNLGPIFYSLHPGKGNEPEKDQLCSALMGGCGSSCLKGGRFSSLGEDDGGLTVNQSNTLIEMFW